MAYYEVTLITKQHLSLVGRGFAEGETAYFDSKQRQSDGHETMPKNHSKDYTFK